MAKQRSSFAKLQRDRAKAAKRAAKLANKGTNSAVPEPLDTASATTTVETVAKARPKNIEDLLAGKDVLGAGEMLEMVETIHGMHQRGDITDEEFEDAKVEIFARLPAE